MKKMITFLVAYALAWVGLIIWIPQGNQLRGEESCQSYQSVTGRETTYVANTCYVKFDGEFYTQEEFKYLLGVKQ